MYQLKTGQFILGLLFSVIFLGAGCVNPALEPLKNNTTSVPQFTVPDSTTKPETKPTTSKPTPKPVTPKPTQATRVSVSISNSSFKPEVVTIKPGTTVVWVNNDSVAHTVTAYDGLFDSGAIPPGGSFTYVFERPVTRSYYCTLHTSMQGTVIVRY